MQTTLLSLMKKRRSIYALGKNITASNEELTDLIQDVIRETPTAFNGQSPRAVILFNDQHDKLWDLTINRLKSEVPDAEAFKNTQAKIQSFKNAYATILFFKDQNVVTGLQEMAPLYAANFPDWSEQTQGSSQFAVWTALAENNIGASIQHYNPLIDEDVKKAFNIPDNWVLRAQMPFGSIEAPAAPKKYLTKEERFIVLK